MREIFDSYQYQLDFMSYDILGRLEKLGDKVCDIEKRLSELMDKDMKSNESTSNEKTA